MNISLSDIDEQRFGIRTVKASHITPSDYSHMLDFCRENHAKLLIARCGATEVLLIQEMERDGFLFMDTIVYYSRDIVNKPIPDDVNKHVKIRPLNRGEEEVVKEIAVRTFSNYAGHYHADTKLDSRKCDAVYSSWAYRSCFPSEVADLMLVAEDRAGRIVGFTSFLLNSRERGCGLSGVDPEVKGQGIYRSLILHGLKWSAEMGDDIVVYDTQLTNVAVQTAWIKMGFLPSHSCHTFHKWFD